MSDSVVIMCPVCDSDEVSPVAMGPDDNPQLLGQTSDGRTVMLRIRTMACRRCGYVLLFRSDAAIWGTARPGPA